MKGKCSVECNLLCEILKADNSYLVNNDFIGDISVENDPKTID